MPNQLQRFFEPYFLYRKHETDPILQKGRVIEAALAGYIARNNMYELIASSNVCDITSVMLQHLHSRGSDGFDMETPPHIFVEPIPRIPGNPLIITPSDLIQHLHQHGLIPENQVAELPSEVFEQRVQRSAPYATSAITS